MVVRIRLFTAVLCYPRLYWAVLGFGGLYWAVLGCTGLNWAVLGFTRMCCAVLGCTWFYWTVLGYCTVSNLNDHGKRNVAMFGPSDLMLTCADMVNIYCDKQENEMLLSQYSTQNNNGSMITREDGLHLWSHQDIKVSNNDQE